MDISRSYSVVISGATSLPKKTLQNTVDCYRRAVGYFIDVILANWDGKFTSDMTQVKFVKVAEELCIPSNKHVNATYDFPKADQSFNRFPSYLRRAAIAAAFGKVKAYQSLKFKWDHEAHKKGANPPGQPNAGKCFPPLYRKNMFEGRLWADYCYLQQTNDPDIISEEIVNKFRRASIKLYDNNAWRWFDITLNRGDIKYILRHCAGLDESVPTLVNKGKTWKLNFLFKQEVKLTTKAVSDQLAVSVDLGLNNACVCSVMSAAGTVLGREFLKMPCEEAHMRHVLNLIRKAQHNGVRKNKKLWSRVKGINRHISVETARFIMAVATKYNADVIVMEHLNLQGKRCRGGSKRQRLSLWKARDVQQMVERKAHICCMRFSTVCAWNTSRLAFDGSGYVLRDKDNYSMCTFQNREYVKEHNKCSATDSRKTTCPSNVNKPQSASTAVDKSSESKNDKKNAKEDKYNGGKRYHCDLSASYNIGARYFIRGILKTLDSETRQHIQAKVPECAHGSTCCLNTLISLNAELRSLQSGALTCNG